MNNITTEYTNLLIVINAQTFLTSCSEFILPFLVSDHVSYFVYACDVLYSSLQKICILATVNKNTAEYTNLLTVITCLILFLHVTYCIPLYKIFVFLLQ